MDEQTFLTKATNQMALCTAQAQGGAGETLSRHGHGPGPNSKSPDCGSHGYLASVEFSEKEKHKVPVQRLPLTQSRFCGAVTCGDYQPQPLPGGGFLLIPCNAHFVLKLPS